MKQFLKYNFFQIVRYFWNPFACLVAKYVTGGLFDKRNEGSFFTWGFRLHGYVYPRHCEKRAIVLHCTQHDKRLSDSQNDFWIRFRCTTEWLANFYPERPENSSPVSPGHRSKMAARRPWSFFLEMNLTPERSHFLQNFRLHLIDLSRRLERMLMKMLLTMCCFGCTKLRWYHLSSLAASVDLDVFNEVQTSMLVQKGQYIKIYLYTSR